MNWAEYLENADEIIEDENLSLDEKIAMKTIIRDRKRVKKWVTNKVGWKIEYDKNHMPREVKISATEAKKRKIAQKKAAAKRKNPLYQKKRLKSFAVRDKQHIEYNKDMPAINTAREKGEKVKSDVKGALTQKLENMKEKLKRLLQK